MTSHHRAQAGYGDTSRAVNAPRQIEYQAFARITHGLSAAIAAEGPGAFPALAEAMHQNLKLWTILAGEMADPNNGLPEKLRAQLLSLALFTREHTSRVLAREATAEALVEINTAIMRGLRAQNEAALCPA